MNVGGAGSRMRRAELRDRADDVIEAGGPCRLKNENIVGCQLVEPDAFCWRREKAPQPVDGCGNVDVGTAVREIGADPFRLRPQARHRIMDAAIGEHGIDRHAPIRIEPSKIGECDQPSHRLGRLSAG
jgi:hypothetical protein